MKYFRPDKNALITLRIFIFSVSLIILAVIRLYIPMSIVLGIAAIALGTVDIFFIFIYLPLYFRALSFESDENGITKHSGVIFKSHQSVRYSTVQYTTVINAPFSKYTGINIVILFAYGGQLRLMFLSEEDALHVLKRAGNAAERRWDDVS